MTTQPAPLTDYEELLDEFRQFYFGATLVHPELRDAATEKMLWPEETEELHVDTGSNHVIIEGRR